MASASKGHHAPAYSDAMLQLHVDRRPCTTRTLPGCIDHDEGSSGAGSGAGTRQRAGVKATTRKPVATGYHHLMRQSD